MSDSDTEDVQICTNCERKIETSKYKLHATVCHKQNYKCKECGAIVNKRDRATHEATEHFKAKCDLCQMLIQDLAIHETECPEKLRTCHYCSKDFKPKDIDSHQKQCGQVESKCGDCQAMVKNSELEKHTLSGECKKKEDLNKKAPQEVQKKVGATPHKIVKQPTKSLNSKASVATLEFNAKPAAPQRSRLYDPIRNNKPWEEAKKPEPAPKKVIRPPVAAPKIIYDEKGEPIITSSFQPSDQRGRESVFEEDAALIAQLLEEDDSWRVARHVQDSAFDGQTYPNPQNHSHHQVHTISPLQQSVQQQHLQPQPRNNIRDMEGVFQANLEGMTEEEQMALIMQMSNQQ